MKRWLSLALFLVLFIPFGAHAVRATEGIEHFDSKITIDSNNRPHIVETINYYFDSLHHGIERSIPVTYNRGTDNVYYTSFKLIGVTQDGQAVKVSQSSTNDGDNVLLRIGDPNLTVSGEHTYRIEYELYPLITQGSSADVLAFDVTGNDTLVETDLVTAEIVVNGSKAVQAACYTGTFGLKEQECTVTPTSTGYAYASTRILLPHEGMSIGLDLPKGFVSTYLLPNVKPPIEWSKYYPVMAAGGVFLLALAYLVGTFIQDGLRRKSQTVIAQYEAPDGLTPSEIGALVDSKTSMIEVTAMLVNAAVHGFLRIEQISKPNWLGQAKYRLHKLKDFKGLPENEASLLSTIMDGAESKDLDDVDNTVVPEAIKDFRESLAFNLKQKNYYAAKGPMILGLGSINAAAIIRTLFFLGFFFGSGLIALLVFSVGQIIVLLVLAVGIVIYALLRPRLTNEGLKEWAEVKGFQLFLSVTEKDRLKFTDAPEKTPQLFSKLLPYAIALGVEKQWAKQFDGINLEDSANWYYGAYYGDSFSSSALASDLSSSFASSVSSGFAAPSSSGSDGSSFSGGGGSSGGGFGGGGTGSW